MKYSMIFVLLAAMLVAVSALPYRDRITLPRPNPGSPGFPSFPGHGPFNPKIPSGPWGRYRRSPESEIRVEQPFDELEFPSESLGY